MNADTIFLAAGLADFFGLLRYGLAVWAIRSAKSPAERKAQIEVAKKAVAASPARSLLKLPGPGGKGTG